MKHLCFHYTLSFAARFNVLYTPVWLLFLCCLSFMELVNANQCWDVINFLPADKMSVRQEGAWSLVHVLWAQTACSQQFYPAVHSYSRNKWISKRVADFIFKKWKKGFLKILRKLKQRNGVCYQNHGAGEKTSDCYLHAAKFTESLLQTPATMWYSLKGQSRFMVQSFPNFSPYFV